ncbi:hypothetical protein [Salinithrix halophila]|uniref:Uncharacterized protein n=1 Tax=Salinithrix halophila TaxID=1485204 RepID=A0ABV8JH84_9BACL
MEKPVFPQEIIVGVTYKKRWSWYITDKGYWFLDQIKLGEEFIKKGHKIDLYDFSGRFNIGIVNEETAGVFLNYIGKHQVDTHSMSKMVKEVCETTNDLEEMMDLSPSLFVDFDTKRLISMFTEPASFEHYVPEGWLGIENNFLREVPEAERYWVVNGRDYFNEFFGEGYLKKEKRINVNRRTLGFGFLSLSIYLLGIYSLSLVFLYSKSEPPYEFDIRLAFIPIEFNTLLGFQFVILLYFVLALMFLFRSEEKVSSLTNIGFWALTSSTFLFGIKYIILVWAHLMSPRSNLLRLLYEKDWMYFVFEWMMDLLFWAAMLLFLISLTKKLGKNSMD